MPGPNHLIEKRILPPRGMAVIMTVLSASLFLLKTSSAQGGNGKALFEKRCSGCHALESDHEGPRLKGVVGRRAGTVRTFDYSNAMRSAKLTWDASLLDKWLTEPDSVVPGTDMSFRVPKADERTAIVEYLKDLK